MTPRAALCEGACSLPGRAFTSPEDFNVQLAQWLPKANAWLVRWAGARRAEPIGQDKAATLGLHAGIRTVSLDYPKTTSIHRHTFFAPEEIRYRPANSAGAEVTSLRTERASCS